MNLQQYVERRKAELDQFLSYNEVKFAELGEEWMPEEQELPEWYDQEQAWLEMKIEEENAV